MTPQTISAIELAIITAPMVTVMAAAIITNVKRSKV